jgi:hypothetical protein
MERDEIGLAQQVVERQIGRAKLGLGLGAARTYSIASGMRRAIAISKVNA